MADANMQQTLGNHFRLYIGMQIKYRSPSHPYQHDFNSKRALAYPA
jgi:hypothetical protein